jgi:regulatory protein
MQSLRQPQAKADVIDEVPVDAQEARRGGSASPRNLAMNWLARREHTLAELRAKLSERDFSPAEIESAVVTLAADGLVSDDRFAESFIAVRMRKGQGPVRICMDLQQRGVSAELIAMHLDPRSPEWLKLAREVRNKKFGTEIPADFKEKARQMRFLEYRGFSSAHIRSAMDDDFDSL